MANTLAAGPARCAASSAIAARWDAVHRSHCLTAAISVTRRHTSAEEYANVADRAIREYRDDVENRTVLPRAKIGFQNSHSLVHATADRPTTALPSRDAANVHQPATRPADDPVCRRR